MFLFTSHSVRFSEETILQIQLVVVCLLHLKGETWCRSETTLLSTALTQSEPRTHAEGTLKSPSGGRQLFAPGEIPPGSPLLFHVFGPPPRVKPSTLCREELKI